MIELIINNTKADLPEGNEIDMEYENELFTSSSEYSLDIELLLAGSTTNQLIFGNINRLTLSKDRPKYKAEIYCNGRCICNGYAVVLDCTDISVKIQMVGNTSYTNYISKDIYIDKMDLGYFFMKKFPDHTFDPTWRNIDYIQSNEYKYYFGSVDETDAVLFWAYYKDPNTITKDTEYWLKTAPNAPIPMFTDDNKPQLGISNFPLTYNCQPYLIKAIEKVVTTMGFKLRRNDISHCWMRNLYICNYRLQYYDNWLNFVESAPDGYMASEAAKSLPHWTVSKFIDEVEKFCACIFLFNTYNMTVDIIQIDKYYDEQTAVYEIPADNILDAFEFKNESDSEEKDMSNNNISFAKEYTDKFIRISEEIKNAISRKAEYDNYQSLLQAFNTDVATDRDTTLYIDKSNGREYIAFKEKDSDEVNIKEVNIFGDLIRKEDGNTTELNIVPANTAYFDVGVWNNTNLSKKITPLMLNVPFSSQEQTNKVEYTTAQDIIDNNISKEEKGESNDKMEVMISTGKSYLLVNHKGTDYKYPVPFSDFQMESAAKGQLPEMSLSLKNVCKDSLGYLYRHIPSYRSNEKYIIKFTDIRVPDVRNIFLIKNQKYMCRKLSTTFNNSTSNNIIEGEFYRIS